MKFIVLLLRALVYVFYIALLRNLAGLDKLQNQDVLSEIFEIALIIGETIVALVLTKLTISYLLKAVVGEHE